jgi:hypothetical protein
MSEENTQSGSPEGETGSWRDSLPEQLRDAPYFRKAESLDQVRSDLDGAAFWQGNSILKPSADATDEQKATNMAKLRELYPNLVDPESEDIYTQLGKPEEHTQYDVPEGIAIADDEITHLKQIAHAASMTKRQFREYISQLNTARQTGMEIGQEEARQDAEALRKEWGEATDGRKELVGKYLKTDPNVPESMVAAYDAGNLTSGQFKWLYSLASQGDESAETSTHERYQKVGMSPLEGAERAKEIRLKLMDMRPGDPAYQAYLNQLMEADKAASAGG